MGAYSNSVAAIFQQGQSIASNWIVEDDITFSFGDGSDFKLLFDSATGLFQITDVADNILLKLTDQGTYGLLTTQTFALNLDIFPSGTIFNIAYTTAETLTSTLYGIKIDLETNITVNQSQAIYGLHITYPTTYAGTAGSSAIYVSGRSQVVELLSRDTFTSGGTHNFALRVSQGSSYAQYIINPSGNGFAYFELLFSTNNSNFIYWYADVSKTVNGSLSIWILDFQTNFTHGEGNNFTGFYLTPPNVSTTVTTATITYQFFTITSSTLTLASAATYTWYGVNITTPNITQTSGTITAYGIYLTAGTITTGGTQILISLDAGASGIGIDFSRMSAGEQTMKFVADATDPTGAGGAATGRIAINVGGATKYLAYY